MVQVFICDLYEIAAEFSRLNFFLPRVHDLIAEFFLVIVYRSHGSVEDEGFAVIKSEMMDFYTSNTSVLVFLPSQSRQREYCAVRL